MKKQFIILLCLAIVSLVIVVVSNERQERDFDEIVLFQTIDVSDIDPEDIKSSFSFANDVEAVNGQLNIYMSKFWADKMSKNQDKFEFGRLNNEKIKYYVMNEYFYSVAITTGPSFLEQVNPSVEYSSKDYIDQFNYPITIEY